jgi:hypothetical protein
MIDPLESNKQIRETKTDTARGKPVATDAIEINHTRQQPKYQRLETTATKTVVGTASHNQNCWRSSIHSTNTTAKTKNHRSAETTGTKSELKQQPIALRHRQSHWRTPKLICRDKTTKSPA